MNMDYYSNHSYNNIEIAICLEVNENTGKFYVPALTPFLDGDKPYDEKDPPSSTSNIISGVGSMDVEPCTTSNYIVLDIPEYINSLSEGDKVTITFVGGDINKPIILGRYNK